MRQSKRDVAKTEGARYDRPHTSHLSRAALPRSREYSARDLEGNLWSFGTYDPYAGE